MQKITLYIYYGVGRSWTKKKLHRRKLSENQQLLKTCGHVYLRMVYSASLSVLCITYGGIMALFMNGIMEVKYVKSVCMNIRL